MQKTLQLAFGLALLLTSGSCASKHYAKQAQKYDQAGLYRDAAQMYYQSVAANAKNIDAKMGLQRTGQLLLQEKISSFKTHFDNNAPKEAVYAFIEAQNYYDQVKNVGVMLIFPPENNVYYSEVKDKYLGTRYAEGLLALDVEDFSSSETIFAEIISIDKTYKDSKTHWTTSKYEPLYRKAISQYETGLYRTAYTGFNAILTATGPYKDVIALKAEALSKAVITIAVVPFASAGMFQSGHAQTLRTKTINELNQLKSPFYKVVTEESLISLPADGRKSQTADLIKFISTFSQSISARAILTGRMVRLSEKSEPLSTTERKGYLKHIEDVKDKTTGEIKKETIYDKVIYHEHFQKNESYVSFEFTLIDVKTGAILVTDMINLSRESKINYASFQGDPKKLVPGYWKQHDKKLPEDLVSDNVEKVSQLQSLLNADRQIKTAQSLTTELIAEVSKQVALAIENYNPER